jgi:RES domain
MSSSIWMPAALSSRAIRLAGNCWRAVEAQHRISTMKLTDTVSEQERLEELIEEVKPAVPPECRGLDFLLSTPFRYGPYPRGSRFRRAGLTPGVFYASERPATAIAEMTFFRLTKFFAESPATPWPSNASEITVFEVEFETDRAIDLTSATFRASHASWTHVTDYDACQNLAEAARTAAIDVIRYQSVRHPMGINFALLTCRAFAKPAEVSRQTWRIYLSASGARALCEMPNVSLDFDRNAFLPDPRIVGMRWER